MKPVPFDMTPLAKALEMPGTKREQKNQLQEARKGTADKGRPSMDRVGIFPRHLAPDAGWLSTLAQEQIHALATHVLARHTEDGLRTVALTSAMAGEGKTTMTLALAEKLASADKRVLIVDLDTHRGTLTREAELENCNGALEVTGKRKVNDSLPCYATDCRGVSIMPTGHVDYTEGAIPLLSPDRILSIVKRSLEDHDIVLLDCPPLLPVADTHVIGDIADTAILVVRAGMTPREVLGQAIQEFGKEKFFAVVLNRARPANIPYFREVYGYYRRDS